MKWEQFKIVLLFMDHPVHCYMLVEILPYTVEVGIVQQNKLGERGRWLRKFIHSKVLNYFYKIIKTVLAEPFVTFL